MNLDPLNKWLTLFANLAVVGGIALVAVQIHENTVATRLAYDGGLLKVRRDEVRAVRGAIDAHFSLAAATDGANFFALRRTEPLRGPFLADGTAH